MVLQYTGTNFSIFLMTTTLARDITVSQIFGSTTSLEEAMYIIKNDPETYQRFLTFSKNHVTFTSPVNAAVVMPH